MIRHTGQVIPIKQKLSCSSQNCLYICTCISTVCTSKIGKGEYKGQYIGQTERKVRDRWMDRHATLQRLELQLRFGTILQHLQRLEKQRKITAILIPNFKLKQECKVHKPQPVSQIFIFTFCLLLLWVICIA